MGRARRCRVRLPVFPARQQAPVFFMPARCQVNCFNLRGLAVREDVSQQRKTKTKPRFPHTHARCEPPRCALVAPSYNSDSLRTILYPERAELVPHLDMHMGFVLTLSLGCEADFYFTPDLIVGMHQAQQLGPRWVGRFRVDTQRWHRCPVWPGFYPFLSFWLC